MQGEGGFYPAPKAFMQRLRALCDQHGILLIADEVQTGAGRTGTFFATEQLGIVPDLTTFAKSVGGGFPISGVCGKAEIMDAVAPDGLGALQQVLLVEHLEHGRRRRRRSGCRRRCRPGRLRPGRPSLRRGR